MDSHSTNPLAIVGGSSSSQMTVTPAVALDWGSFHRRLPQYYAAITAALGVWLFGMALGWFPPVFNRLISELGLTVEEASFLVNVMVFAAVPGMLVTALTIDRWGRRPVMLALCPPCAAGWALIAFGHSMPMLLVGRILTIFCGSAFCGVVSIYTGEIAEKQIRGMLGVFYELLLTCGMMYALVVGQLASLQMLGLACGAVPVLFMVLFFYAPETPLYLLACGRREDAITALCWLRGPTADISGDLTEMEEVMNSAEQQEGGMLVLLRSRATCKSLGTGIGLIVWQQLSGVHFLMFYTPRIFYDADINLNANTIFIILCSIQVFSMVVMALVVDRVGRRPLLLLSHVGMAVSMAGVGTFLHLLYTDYMLGLTWLPVASVCGFLFFFSIGSGPLPWVILGEVPPYKVKSASVAIVGATNLILNAGISKLVLYSVEEFGVRSNVIFWIFAVICLVGALWVSSFLIETKGKSLVQIQRELSGARVV